MKIPTIKITTILAVLIAAYGGYEHGKAIGSGNQQTNVHKAAYSDLPEFIDETNNTNNGVY